MNLILISGWAVSGNHLSLLIKELLKILEVRVVSIHELPSLVSGAGAGRKASASTISDYTRGLAGIVEETGPCLLMGWSTGGMIALEAAVHLQEKLKGLFLISSAARFCSASDYRHGISPPVLRAMMLEIRKDPERTLAGFFERTHKPFDEDPELIGAEVETALSIGSEELSSGLKYLLETDLRDSIGSIKIPSVVLHGKEDAVIPWQAGRLLSDNIRKSSFRLFDGVGHDLPVRAAGSIVEEVERALKTIG